MTGKEIREEAAKRMQAITIDPALIALVELKPCRRCRNGLYSTQRGLEGCSTCVAWKPGFRPTVSGIKALRRAQIDAQLRTLRIEYVMERALLAIGEGLDACLDNVTRRGLALRSELTELGA